MVNRDVIPELKSATVGIGTWDRNAGPKTVKGTGFLIDPEGYVVTATHVINASLESQKEIEDTEGLKTDIAIFRYQPKGDNVDYSYARIEEICTLTLKPEMNEGKSESWDVTVCKLSKPKKPHPFLTIETDFKIKVWDEIFMCGYPGGNASLSIKKNPTQTRISPLLQYGHISGLMPHDSFSKPQAIQTDIISTGGSSGSPIVNAQDGKVVAIAQNVIGGTAFLPTGRGIVNTGMVYGASFHIMKGLNNIVKSWKKGERYTGKVNTSFGRLGSITKY